MHYGSVLKDRLAAIGRASLGPLVFGAAAFLMSTAPTAFSDIPSLLSGMDHSKPRWQAYLVEAPAGSIHRVEMAFDHTGTKDAVLAQSGITLPDGRTVAFRAKNGPQSPLSDEQRVNRRDKKGRVTTTVPVAPPKDFSAGSILHRSHLLAPPRIAGDPQMVFVKPKIAGREIEIATAFHRPVEPAADTQLPVMLADLVTNDEADVRATAYTPTRPDYTRKSPFASLLVDELRQGRFFPPIAENDHDWAGDPLPPHVFSTQEQHCLASGIYFEARGEPVEGQTAVAQVILNRVRNPAYPNTICAVVYQNKRWRNRCQFSFACDGLRDRVRSRRHWSIAEDVGMAVAAGKIWLEQVGSATHYHAVYVRPNWARGMKRVGRIGLHIFYRTYGGGWS